METRLGRALIAGDLRDGTTIVVDAEADELVVRWRDPDEEAGVPPEAVGAPA